MRRALAVPAVLILLAPLLGAVRLAEAPLDLALVGTVAAGASWGLWPGTLWGGAAGVLMDAVRDGGGRLFVVYLAAGALAGACSENGRGDALLGGMLWAAVAQACGVLLLCLACGHDDVTRTTLERWVACQAALTVMARAVMARLSPPPAARLQ